MRGRDAELRKNCSAYGSIIPVSGCCPWLHGGSSESMALREGGMIIEAWPAAQVVSAAINVSRMARRAAEVLLAVSDAQGYAGSPHMAPMIAS